VPIFSQSQSKILADVLGDILDNSNITRVSPGSKMRALAQAMSNKLGRMWNQFDINMVQAFLSGAEGQYLDLIGMLLGVLRLGEQTANISAAEKVTQFYVDTGTFGDINGGSSIHIPQNTIVSTQANAQGILYRLTYAVILAATDNSMFVPVEAISVGPNSNLGAGQLIYHNFSNYTDFVKGTLKITNDADIVNGSSVEIDTNYRYRIANQVVAAESANQTAVRIAALLVPGVADVLPIPFARGVGSFDLLIKATTPSVPASLLPVVTDSVGKAAAHGIAYSVRGPIETGLQLSTTISFKTALSSTDQNSIITAVSSNLTNYINNLDIGEALIINQMDAIAMSTSSQIKNIGKANLPFTNVWIWTPTPDGSTKIRNTLLGDYQPDADEKVLVEPILATATPLLVTPV
jgi:uncharacterized phage protein gp47/JayE